MISGGGVWMDRWGLLERNEVLEMEVCMCVCVYSCCVFISFSLFIVLKAAS